MIAGSLAATGKPGEELHDLIVVRSCPGASEVETGGRRGRLTRREGPDSLYVEVNHGSP